MVPPWVENRLLWVGLIMSDELTRAEFEGSEIGGAVADAETTVETLISDSKRQIAGGFRIEELIAEVHEKSPEELAAIRAEVEQVQRFLTAALVAHRAAGEPAGVHVDGQIVPRELAALVLDWHLDAAQRTHHQTSVITISGLRIRFIVDADHQPTVAFVDAAGTAHRFTRDQLPGALILLERPNAITIVARMRLMIEQLDRIIRCTFGLPE